MTSLGKCQTSAMTRVADRHREGPADHGDDRPQRARSDQDGAQRHRHRARRVPARPRRLGDAVAERQLVAAVLGGQELEQLGGRRRHEQSPPGPRAPGAGARGTARSAPARPRAPAGRAPDRPGAAIRLSSVVDRPAAAQRGEAAQRCAVVRARRRPQVRRATPVATRPARQASAASSARSGAGQHAPEGTAGPRRPWRTSCRMPRAAPRPSRRLRLGPTGGSTTAADSRLGTLAAVYEDIAPPPPRGSCRAERLLDALRADPPGRGPRVARPASRCPRTPAHRARAPTARHPRRDQVGAWRIACAVTTDCGPLLDVNMTVRRSVA